MKSSLKIKNNLSELANLEEHLQSLESQWGLSKKIGVEINLVLDELITNIIEHGDQENLHFIDISLTKKCQKLTIEVKDDGPPFDPTRCKMPDTTQPLEERRCGGLGIFLVRKFSDCCSYKRSDNKNIFTLQKTLPKECR